MTSKSVTRTSAAGVSIGRAFPYLHGGVAMVELTGLPYEVIKANLASMAETAEAGSPPARFNPFVCSANKQAGMWCKKPSKNFRHKLSSWNARLDVERIVFPSGGVLHSDGTFRGPMRLAVHLQRLVDFAGQKQKT